MDFYKSFRGMVLVRLRITKDYAVIDRSTREIKKQGSFADCNDYFDIFVKENSN